LLAKIVDHSVNEDIKLSMEPTKEAVIWYGVNYIIQVVEFSTNRVLLAQREDWQAQEYKYRGKFHNMQLEINRLVHPLLFPFMASWFVPLENLRHWLLNAISYMGYRHNAFHLFAVWFWTYDFTRTFFFAPFKYRFILKRIYHASLFVRMGEENRYETVVLDS
jgi:hypothetical protein